MVTQSGLVNFACVSENEIFKKIQFSIQARMIEGVRFKKSFNA